MAATQAAQSDPPDREGGWQTFRRAVPAHIDIESACATHEKLAPFLGIQIEQQSAVLQPGLQSARATHAGFLAYRQQGFDRAMDQRPILENGQDQGDADAVVGIKRRLVGDQPAITTKRPNRVAGRIVRCSPVVLPILLANHIEVSL